MSYLERTAKKLVPILVELKKRMIPEKNLGGNGKSRVDSIDSLPEELLFSP